MSTVGYGDINAETVLGRICVVFFIMFGLVSVLSFTCISLKNGLNCCFGFYTEESLDLAVQKLFLRKRKSKNRSPLFRVSSDDRNAENQKWMMFIGVLF